MTTAGGQVTVVDEWSTFPSSEGGNGGLEYFSRTWHPRGPLKATVLFIHGLGEHISRYATVFPVFASNGIKVLGWDERGFGQTGRKNGILGHNGGDKVVLRDIAQVEARLRVPGVPHFVMGQSMGGGLALKYASTHPPGLTGVIGCSPLVSTGSKTTPSLVEYWAVRSLSNVLKTFVMNNPVDPKELSRDPQVVKDYSEDPLVHTYGSFETCMYSLSPQ